MMDYFKPLMTWLEEQNKAAKLAGNRSDVRVQNSEVSLVLARSAFGVQCVFASI
jgi:hypothetical protein